MEVKYKGKTYKLIGSRLVWKNRIGSFEEVISDAASKNEDGYLSPKEVNDVKDLIKNGGGGSIPNAKPLVGDLGADGWDNIVAKGMPNLTGRFTDSSKTSYKIDKLGIFKIITPRGVDALGYKSKRGMVAVSATKPSQFYMPMDIQKKIINKIKSAKLSKLELSNKNILELIVNLNKIIEKL